MSGKPRTHFNYKMPLSDYSSLSLSLCLSVSLSLSLPRSFLVWPRLWCENSCDGCILYKIIHNAGQRKLIWIASGVGPVRLVIGCCIATIGPSPVGPAQEPIYKWSHVIPNDWSRCCSWKASFLRCVLYIYSLRLRKYNVLPNKNFKRNFPILEP